MRKRMNDYPVGVQDLLRWAGYYLEQLDGLEREFRAWEQAQDIGRVQVVTLETAGAALRADRMRKAGESLAGPSYAEAARWRWERRERGRPGGEG
jgi:hypothetical protein